MADEKNQGNNQSNSRGTNQYDVQVAQARGTNEHDVALAKVKLEAVATNEHDVNLARVEAEINRLEIELRAQYRKQELEATISLKKFEKLVDAGRWVLTAGIVMGGIVLSSKIGGGVSVEV